MNQRDQRLVIPIVLVALVGVLVALPVAAAEPVPPEPGYQPPVYAQPEISLAEAVRVTLEHEPAIMLQGEAARNQQGVAQQATGQFDLTLTGSASFGFTQSQIPKSQLASEDKKRTDLAKTINQYATAGDQDQQQLDDLDKAQLALNNGTTDGLLFSGLDPTFVTQLQLYLDLIKSVPPGQQATETANVQAWLASRRATLQADLAYQRALQADKQEQLRKLGRTPTIQDDYKGSFSLQLSKEYRNGTLLSPYFNLSGQGTGYKGKMRSADYGGPGIDDSYDMSIGFSVSIPVGRGGGVESAGAQEAAANIDYQASVMSITQTASTSVYSSILAYWNLVGAQETVKVYERSLALQSKIVDLTNTLIQADEMPRAELARAQAREAELRASLDDGKRALHEARMTLARTIGLQANQVNDAPLASDEFPEPPTIDVVDAMKPDALASGALENRYDLKAARLTQQSGKVLWRAAEVDLRAVKDVSLKVFYQGHNEDNRMASGIGKAVGGMWAGPSASLGYNYEKPYGNNVQLGLLEQQAATYRQRAISAADLERTIKSGVLLAAGSLQEAVRQWQRYVESVGFYRQAVDTEIEKLRLGTSTLIDTITTEQQLVNAELSLVSSRQQVATTLAQLRYETGTLVAEQGKGNVISLEHLNTVPQPGQAAK